VVTSDSAASSEAEAPGDCCADRASCTVPRESGDVARQIVAIAREHGVPIEEDGDLLSLLERLDAGEEISAELFATVAEVLAVAYAVNGEYLAR
jgi:flagellar biosynthesis protein